MDKKNWCHYSFKRNTTFINGSVLFGSTPKLCSGALGKLLIKYLGMGGVAKENRAVFVGNEACLPFSSHMSSLEVLDSHNFTNGGAV